MKQKIGLHLKLIGYFCKLLNPETIKLLGTTKSKITKDEHHEDVEITEM